MSRPLPPADDEAEYDEGESQRLHPLVSLAAKIAASYAGFNASAPVLTYLTLEGAKAGLRDPPASFDFLHVGCPLITAGWLGAVNHCCLPVCPPSRKPAYLSAMASGHGHRQHLTPNLYLAGISVASSLPSATLAHSVPGPCSCAGGSLLCAAPARRERCGGAAGGGGRDGAV